MTPPRPLQCPVRGRAWSGAAGHHLTVVGRRFYLGLGGGMSCWCENSVPGLVAVSGVLLTIQSWCGGDAGERRSAPSRRYVAVLSARWRHCRWPRLPLAYGWSGPCWRPQASTSPSSPLGPASFSPPSTSGANPHCAGPRCQQGRGMSVRAAPTGSASAREQLPDQLRAVYVKSSETFSSIRCSVVQVGVR